MSVAVAVGFIIVATVPGRDYDPSNGWVEHQEVPAIYDQRILEQVSWLLLSASAILRFTMAASRASRCPRYTAAHLEQTWISNCSISMPFDGLS